MRIDTGISRNVVEFLRAQRLAVEPMLARAGLDADTLSRKGARIPFAAHVALLEHAAAAARDLCFGLHLGAALHPRDLGLVGYLGASAATLGDVLGVAAKYRRLITEGTRVVGRDGGRTGAGRATYPRPRRSRQSAGRRPGREQSGTGGPAPHRDNARASVDRAAVRQSRR